MDNEFNDFLLLSMSHKECKSEGLYRSGYPVNVPCVHLTRFILNKSISNRYFIDYLGQHINQTNKQANKSLSFTNRKSLCIQQDTIGGLIH